MCETIRKSTTSKKARDDIIVRTPTAKPEDRARLHEVTTGGSWVRNLLGSLRKETRTQEKKEKEREEA